MNDHLMDQFPSLIQLDTANLITQTLCSFFSTSNALLGTSVLMCLSSKLKEAARRNQQNVDQQQTMLRQLPQPVALTIQDSTSNQPTTSTSTSDLANKSQVVEEQAAPSNDFSSPLIKIQNGQNHAAATRLLAWSCVGASVAGTSHADNNIVCQDYHTYCYLPTGQLVIAVADGAGSAQHADEGAAIACHTALNFLQRKLDCHGSELLEEDYDLIMREAFAKARSAIIDRATTTGVAVSEYATTLIIMILTPEMVIGGMVGDGMAIVEYDSGDFVCLFDLLKHEYANQMVAIISPRALELLQISVAYSPIQSVSIITDGLLRMSCDLQIMKPFPPFFRAMTSIFELTDHDQSRRELATLLDHPLINEKTEDDKTLVMARAVQVVAGNPRQSDGNCEDRVEIGEGREDEDIRPEWQDVSGREQVA